MQAAARGRRFLAMAVVGLAMTASWASAHQTDRAEQSTEVRVEAGEVESLLSISADDLAHHLGAIRHGQQATQEILSGLRAELSAYLDGATGVDVDGQPCELVAGEFLAYPGGDGRVHYHQRYRCKPDGTEITLTNRIMVDGHAGYRHMATIEMRGALYPTVFDARFPTYSVYPEVIDDEVPGEESLSAAQRLWQTITGGVGWAVEKITFW